MSFREILSLQKLASLGKIVSLGEILLEIVAFGGILSCGEKVVFGKKSNS